MIGRLLSYWEGNFSGAMLNFGRVYVGLVLGGEGVPIQQGSEHRLPGTSFLCRCYALEFCPEVFLLVVSMMLVFVLSLGNGVLREFGRAPSSYKYSRGL